jgi:hypothetical protein
MVELIKQIILILERLAFRVRSFLTGFTPDGLTGTSKRIKDRIGKTLLRLKVQVGCRDLYIK